MLLALGLAACGGGDSGSAEGGASGGSKQGEAKGGDDAKSGGGGGMGDGGEKPGGSPSSGGEAAEFKPKPHNDSGGGSQQFRQKGGDNSIQEYGAEADVGSLRVEGERSFVIYTGVGGTVLAMPMANEDGEWKVASLSGLPLS